MKEYRQPFKGDYPISQRYGEVIPGVTFQNKPHTGIDYACPEGTEVLASADGIVMAAGWDSTGFGYLVVIQHDKDHTTLYAHLKAVLVLNNQHVKQGNVIGISGRTGYATGPHLHFEARRNWYDYKSHFDPMLLPLKTFSDQLPEDVGEGTIQSEKKDTLAAGVYRVACEYAFVRRWGTVQRSNIVLQKGDRVYIFDDVKWKDDLPFHFIGANLCIAEYDYDGTVILEKYDGKEE